MKLLLDQTISGDSSQVLLRSKLRAVTRRMGFTDTLRERMELVCNEIVSNQVKYAGGKGLVQIWEEQGRYPCLDLFALDYGPGIANLPAAKEDGFTTTGTMGKGLGAIIRLSAESEFYTLPMGMSLHAPWHGTAIWARFYQQETPPAQAYQAGYYIRAYQDDVHNGDMICQMPQAGRMRWLHADGLGHGVEAAETVKGSCGVLDAEANLETMLERLSSRLRGTRGAVAMTCEVEMSEQKARICGVGDMDAYLICNGAKRTIGFSPGVLGHAHRHFVTEEISFPQQALLITSSDGLRKSWGLDTFPGLWRLHPQFIAMFLGLVVGRNNDDKSVFVIRSTPAA